jgi:hypothetical protein
MSIYDDLPSHGKLDGAWAGKFANNPASFDANAFVIIPRISTTNRIGPMRFTRCQGTSLPVRGDSCLVLYDERENPYIVAWWPTSGGGGS